MTDLHRHMRALRHRTPAQAAVAAFCSCTQAEREEVIQSINRVLGTKSEPRPMVFHNGHHQSAPAA